jgi:hypothetical protein
MLGRYGEGLSTPRRTGAGGLALLLVVGLCACAGDAKRTSNDAVTGRAIVADARATSDGSQRSVCDGTPDRWTSVDYTDVDLGPNVHGGLGYIPGPSTVATIRSQEEWTRVWKRIADTVPTPRVSLRNSVVIVLATKEFTSGPEKLDVVRLRLCRDDETASVEYRLRYSAMQDDYGDRAIRAIAIPRSVLGKARVHFVKLPERMDDP